MLGEASASFISTAEPEMHTAPAVAAAAGGIVRAGIGRRPPRGPVMIKHAMS
jgi:hypothetical protein